MGVDLDQLFKVDEGEKASEHQLREALEYIHKITETSPVGIVVVNKTGEIEFANQRAEATLGLQKSDITKLKYNDPEWRITDFEGGEFPEDQLPFMRVMNEQKSVFNVQHAIEWPDKRMVFLSINASPKFNENNEFDGMVASIEDISERVLRDKQLKEISTFREMIIKNAAEGLCVCHNCEEFPYVNFTVWNYQIEKITGYTLEEINELGWYQSLYKDEAIREKAIARMGAMREGEDIISEEWEITTKSEQKKTISISTSIISIEGETTHVMALITDTTEKRKQREEIRKHNEELKRRNEVKDRFMSILSHDLKGPMGAQLELLMTVLDDFESCETERLKKYVQVMFENSKSSYDLLENILNWAKVQIGAHGIKSENFFLKDIILETIDLYKVALSSKQLDLHLDIEHKCMIQSDKNIVKTVLRNFISNAIKFSYEKGVVGVKVLRLDNKCVISVKDNGVGMSDKVAAGLLQKQETFTTRGTKQEKGNGLGLSICKDMLDSLGGSIWVESKEGEGSKFSFTVPDIR